MRELSVETPQNGHLNEIISSVSKVSTPNSEVDFKTFDVYFIRWFDGFSQRVTFDKQSNHQCITYALFKMVSNENLIIIQYIGIYF